MMYTLLLAIVVILRVVGCASIQDEESYDNQGFGAFQSKRDGGSAVRRSKCTFPTIEQPDMRKRDFDDSSDSNRTLVARTMTVPIPKEDDAATMWEFMRAELKPGTTTRLLWEREGKDEDFATSIYEEFKDHKATSIGTNKLCGYTVLAIISREAVYMAHYWESVSFAPDPYWEMRLRDPFEDTVVKGLIRGIRKEQAELKSDYFDNDYVKAYLMHPDGPADDFKPRQNRKRVFEQYYQRRWERIKDIVIGRIPALGQPGRWIDIEYKALDHKDPLFDNSARGTILFKYDPDHRYTSQDGTEMTQRKATLWVEEDVEPRHDDTWDEEPL